MPASALQSIAASPLEALASLLLVGVMVAAVYTDLRWGRIPNMLTFGAAAAGLLLGLLSGGLEGLAGSAGGWLLGAGVLFLFFAIGVMGAGDVKLLAAVGALKGPSFVLSAFVFTGLAGGIAAIAVVVLRRRVTYFAASIAGHIRSLIYVRMLPDREEMKSSPLRFPYGVAIAAGSLAALFWRL